MPATSVASFAGFGLGLRPPHFQDFLGGNVPIDFVEVISETAEHTRGDRRPIPGCHARRLDVDRLGRRH